MVYFRLFQAILRPFSFLSKDWTNSYLLGESVFTLFITYSRVYRGKVYTFKKYTYFSLTQLFILHKFHTVNQLTIVNQCIHSSIINAFPIYQEMRKHSWRNMQENEITTTAFKYQIPANNYLSFNFCFISTLNNST